MNVALFGIDTEKIRPDLAAHASLTIVEDNPSAVICFGGDGTLLTAELRWPGVPKVPIRNSRRGHRMLAHPPSEIIGRLAQGTLVPTEFLKLSCTVKGNGAHPPLAAMNEFNIQVDRPNSAIRYAFWIDDEPFERGVEIIGDGFVVSTPFGSTAYYRQITRGIFYAGLGIAFKYTSELTNHLVVPENSIIRARITRGPAVLGFDNSPNAVPLETGDELLICKDPAPAVILTLAPMRRPSDEF